MRRGKTAHLTVEGTPACRKHWALRKAGLSQCSYTSIAAARRAKLELQKHVYGVKVVTGPCPVA